MEELNLDRLRYYILRGMIDASQPITLKTLLDSHCLSRIKHGVKLLGNVRVSCLTGCLVCLTHLLGSIRF